MAEKKTQYNKVKKPLPDSVKLEAKKEKEPTPVEPKIAFAGVVNSKSGLNVRAAASATAAIIRVLKFNDLVEITDTKGDWGFIGDGWVKMPFITKR